MYVDAALTVSGAIAANTVVGQNITATGTTASTNVIDLSSGNAPNGIGANQTRDIGEGSSFEYLRLEVAAAFNNLTTLEAKIMQSDDAAQSVNVTQVGTTGPIALASLIAGFRTAARINPRIGSKGQRYLWVQYTVVGTAPTTGSVLADFGAEIQDGQKFYPVGFTVN